MEPSHQHACLCDYLIPLGDAEGACSGVAQLIQTTQGHKIRLTSVGKHLIPEKNCVTPTIKFSNFRIQKAGLIISILHE